MGNDKITIRIDDNGSSTRIICFSNVSKENEILELEYFQILVLFFLWPCNKQIWYGYVEFLRVITNSLSRLPEYLVSSESSVKTMKQRNNFDSRYSVRHFEMKWGRGRISRRTTETRKRQTRRSWFEDDCIRIYYSLEATDSLEIGKQWNSKFGIYPPRRGGVIVRRILCHFWTVERS